MSHCYPFGVMIDVIVMSGEHRIIAMMIGLCRILIVMIMSVVKSTAATATVGTSVRIVSHDFFFIIVIIVTTLS